MIINFIIMRYFRLFIFHEILNNHAVIKNHRLFVYPRFHLFILFILYFSYRVKLI